MITDSLFYRLFETSPETLFSLLGIPEDAAKEMAARYKYLAIEFKETSHRTDGVFLPNEANLPLYFVEVQFYARPNIYADLMTKAFTYLKQNNSAQDFCGVVLFASRSLEPADTTPYRGLLASGQVRPFYLDEMPELSNAPLGLSILYLIQREESEAPAVARELVARVRSEISDESLRDDLIELIETVIMYKVTRLTREEIQSMLLVNDIRESRVYQEALEEGEKKGIERGIEEGTNRSIMKLSAKKMTAEQIASMLELDLESVREVLKNRVNSNG